MVAVLNPVNPSIATTGHHRLQAAPSQWGGYQPSYYDLDEEHP